MRFKQICNHPSQLTGDGVYDPAASGKFERLGTLCAEIASRGEKALVFTQFREITDPLAEFLSPMSSAAPGWSCTAAPPSQAAQALVADFQRDDGPPFFVLSIKAGGTGLNLTAASHVIHFDRWWNPAVENQATDRAFRIGQQRNVLVHKFVTRGTIEEKIDALIRDKQDMADALLEGGAREGADGNERRRNPRHGLARYRAGGGVRAGVGYRLAVIGCRFWVVEAERSVLDGKGEFVSGLAGVSEAEGAAPGGAPGKRWDSRSSRCTRWARRSADPRIPSRPAQIAEG